MATFLIDLDGDERRVLQLIKRLLKILARTYGVRCGGIERASEEKT